MKKILIAGFLLSVILAGCGPMEAGLSGSEAQRIADEDCGSTNTGGIYNEGTRTWWFDAEIADTPEGCNPACVVSEETLTAEINWRCTGLNEPDGTVPTNDETVSDIPEDLNGIMVALFTEKYPENTASISVDVTQQTADHARGSVSFAEGMAGGNWLAARVEGRWQLVFDGNGAIPCSLRTDYGFPDDMLSDCAG